MAGHVELSGFVYVRSRVCRRCGEKGGIEMKILIINQSDIIALGGTLEARDKRLQSKLQENKFNLNKPILLTINNVTGKYIYTQKDDCNMTEEEKALIIVKLLAKCMFYGEWKWETTNERVMELLMRELGYYPIENEDEMIAKTIIPDELYQRARDVVK
jgi:hypothetical protein